MKAFFNLLFPIILMSTSFFCSTSSMAQGATAAMHLKQLQEGVLLVKLYSRNPTIEAMRERGLDERAEIFEKEQKFKNLAIASAFEMNYTFGPKVYFFYSDNSKKILERDFEGVLMGYNLQVLNNVNIKDTAFYVAEFGNTQGKNIRALVIRDDSLNYLTSPFPYFVRTFEDFLFFDRTYPRVVEIWNSRLQEEYENYFLTTEELEKLKK